MAPRARRRFARPQTARPVALRVEALEDRTVPTLLGNSLFPADNPWNQKITSAPVAANSAAIMNQIVTTYGNGRLHPDFGQDYNTSADLYGIPYNVVHGNTTPKTSVVIDAYADESDVVPVPLPANVILEGDYQNGPKAGLANRGDSHLLVYDVDNNVAYEFFATSRPGENRDGQWHADQETVWDMKANTFRTVGWTSADAAGLSILAGLVRPDEALPVSQGGQGAINHAIRLTLQNSVILDQFLYPASHIANSGNNAAVQPPMGARFRLKASVDISGLNPEARIVAQAMKDYGLIVADNGSNFYFSGASYAVDGNNAQSATWDDNDIQDTRNGLKSLHFNDFEVVDLTPVVSGLSAQVGPAGTAVTVLGQNFSGAAGHLQVFFGSTPATSVTVVDDGHVVAVTPPGSGTVDVRVQSGVSTAPDTDNVESTVFGYGVSAVTAADLFTYGTAVVTVPGAGQGHPTFTAGVVSSSSGWYLRNSDTSGPPDVGPFAYGGPGWVPLAGDWNGDGRTTVGVFDPGTATWYLRNSNSPGAPDVAPFQYGGPGWRPVVGDWNYPALPQLAADGEAAGAAGLPTLGADALAGIRQAALARLAGAGIDPSLLASLATVRVEVAPLPPGYLGLAYSASGRVVLDDDAAGHGWFVDPTPLDDSEFRADGTAGPGSPAGGRMDLLTVVLHELGHAAGLPDNDGSGLMAETLAAGVRRAGDLAAAFAAEPPRS
jgi:hypothetical protein